MVDAMKIVGMLRVKNEARWIARVLQSMRPICHQLYVFDDHSEDETAAISHGAGARVIASPFSDFNEARDKNWLLGEVLTVEDPEWIVMIDGDEILAEGSHAAIIQAIRLSGRAYNALSFQVLYLWN